MNKLSFLYLLFTITSTYIFGQNFNASLSAKTQRIETTSEKFVSDSFYIKIKADTALKNIKLNVNLNVIKTSIPLYKIFFPQIFPVNIKNVHDTTISFIVSFERDSMDDKNLALEITALNNKGEYQKNSNTDTSIVILIKPYDTGLKSFKNYEVWLHIGTNFDLLDGVKASELYFNFNYLQKIGKSTALQIGAYKNRFGSTIDTQYRVPYADLRFTRDSIYSITGTYTRKRIIKQEPVGIYINFLYRFVNIDIGSNSNLTIYGTLGGEFNIKKQTTDYEYFDILKSDSTISKKDSITGRPVTGNISRLQPIPLQKEYIDNLPNYQFNFGCYLIFDDNLYNIKAQVMLGYNKSLVKTTTLDQFGNVISSYYSSYQNATYLNCRFLATIKSPGLSFGFELFSRNDRSSLNPPLLNFTLSKVFELSSIGSLFKPVTSLAK